MFSKAWLSRFLSAIITGWVLAHAPQVAAQDAKWDKAAWLKKLEAAKAAEGDRMIQYDAQPNYANWGGVTAYFKKNYGVGIPPDMKGSSATLAALAGTEAMESPAAAVL